MPKDQNELDQLLVKLQGVAQTLHLDFTDGKFVPTKNFWFDFKLHKGFSYNAHLMVIDPKSWIKKYGKKVDLCISQWEAIDDHQQFINWLRSQGQKVAFALKPETPLPLQYLSKIDVLQVLTVHPGYYGAPFLKEPLQKIREAKKHQPKIKIIVDGGMNPQTIKEAAKAGADYFVSGSFVTKSDNPKSAMKELEKSIRG